jgi:hypothetical protein
VPKANQALRRCLSLVSRHFGKERFHVLDSLEGPLDAGAKFLLDEDGSKFAQFEIGRSRRAPGE